jgi:N-methylhydantoinase B
VKGGRAGASFQVTIDPGGPDERHMDGLVDDEPVRAGEVIRIRTTGGGGWGDPLDRELAAVERDVLWGKVSRQAAERDYGVVVTGPDDAPVVDEAATAARRTRLRDDRGEVAFFDRGPGYARLDPDGRAFPDVDVV